jgi:hypothetical protein
MRKAFLRLLLTMFKNWEHTVKVQYVYNLRIVKTEKVTAVIVNMWGQKKMSIYFYYMPEKIFLGYTTIFDITAKHHGKVFRIITKIIKRIEEDEVYRHYRIRRWEYACSKRDGK